MAKVLWDNTQCDYVQLEINVNSHRILVKFSGFIVQKTSHVALSKRNH